MTYLTKIKKLLISATVCAVVVSVCGCEEEQPVEQKKARPLPAVSVVTTKMSSPLLSTELAGRTNAMEIAEVRPQVGGIILKRTFKEGQGVAVGQQLYQIDPTVYKADLEKAKANLILAEKELARCTKLYNVKAISHKILEQANATYLTSKSAYDTAKANLDYTKVLSPIAGRVGKSEITPGALVSAYQSQYLTTIVQMDPIYVDVMQSSTELMRIKRDIASGVIKSTKGALEVTLITEDGKEYPIKGLLSFTGETVDPTTGMVNLRAIFKNPHKNLLPGMYVRARIEEGVRAKSIMLNQRCVMHDPRGAAYVYVVTNKNKIERRDIVANRTVKTDYLVESGLSVGEKVVVEGIQSIRNGSSVRVTVIDGTPIKLK